MTKRNLPIRVSCVIAVYNGQRYLREAIDSLLAQDYPEVEIVVVDDGSTDDTPGIIQAYGERVRGIRQDNRGVSVARNVGVEASTGDLLCFLDADDLLDPRKLSLQVEAFAADPRLDLCDCHTRFFWSRELDEPTLRRDPRYADPFWREVLPGHISTWLFGRALWERVGPFEPGKRFAEDVDWLMRAMDSGVRRHTLAEALTERRLHPRNVTADNRAAQDDGLADAMMAHLRRRRKGGAT